MLPSTLVFLSTLAVASGAMSFSSVRTKSDAAASLQLKYSKLLQAAEPIWRSLEKVRNDNHQKLTDLYETGWMEGDAKEAKIKEAERQFHLADLAVRMSQDMNRKVKAELVSKLAVIQPKAASLLQKEEAPKYQMLLNVPKWIMAETSSEDAWFDSEKKSEEKPEKSADAWKTEGVQKIYYINAPHLGSRNEFMQKELRKKAGNITYERFRATTEHEIKGKTGTYSNGHVAEYLKGWGKAGRVSEAIYISVGRLFDKILNEDAQGELANSPILILEDDIQLNKHWHDQVKTALLNVPDDWDILKVAFWGEKDNKMQVNDKIHKACCFEESTQAVPPYLGNQAFLVRPSHVGKILLGLKHRKLQDIDKCLLMAKKDDKPNIRTYAYLENIGEHTNGGGSSRWT